MSELSVLSMQYDKLAAFSNDINNSVIAVKRKRLLSEKNKEIMYSTLSLSEEEWIIYQNILIKFIKSIIEMIELDSSKADFLPSVISEEYKELIQKNMDLADIKRLRSNLEKDGTLDDEDISLLDKMLSILDNKRTVLFKKLRTARG